MPAGTLTWWRPSHQRLGHGEPPPLHESCAAPLLPLQRLFRRHGHGVKSVIFVQEIVGVLIFDGTNRLGDQRWRLPSKPMAT
jgi:hypothetical protein